MSSQIDLIKTMETRLLNAARANNADSIVALLHDDLRFILPSGQIITKEMEHAAYAQQLMSVESLTPSEQEIMLIEDTAIVTVKVQVNGNYENQPINGKFLYLRVWKQTGDTWQVIAGSCTPLTEQ